MAALLDYYCVIFNKSTEKFLSSNMKTCYSIRYANRFLKKEEAENFKNSLPNKDELEVCEIGVSIINRDRNI